MRQGFTNAPTSDGISRVTGKGARERKSQLKSSRWAAHTWTITECRNVSFGHRPAADFGFHRCEEVHPNNSGVSLRTYAELLTNPP